MSGQGQVLLNFAECGGDDGVERVLLAVNGLLLECGEQLVHCDGDCVNTESLEHCHAVFALVGSELDAGDVFRGVDGADVVGEVPEAGLPEIHNGKAAAFVDNTLEHFAEFAVISVARVFLAAEQEGHLINCDARIHALPVAHAHEQGGVHAAVLDHLLDLVLAADNGVAVKVDYDGVVGGCRNILFELLQSDGCGMGLSVHVRDLYRDGFCCGLNGLGCVVRGGFLRSLSACAQGQDHHECEYKCQNFFHFSCVSFLIFCDWYCGMIFIPLELNFTRYSWICQYLFRAFRHFMYHAQFSPTNTVKKQQFTFCCLLLNLDIPISTMYIDFIFV